MQLSGERQICSCREDDIDRRIRHQPGHVVLADDDLVLLVLALAHGDTGVSSFRCSPVCWPTASSRTS
jgi:hypothetical protein